MTEPTADWEDPAPRPRRRAPRGTGPLAVLAVLVLVSVGAVLGGRALLAQFGAPPADYPGPGTGRVTVEVPKGASAARIGEILAGKDVVRSAAAFREAARQDPRSRAIQPGYYALRLQMKASLALSLLLDPASRIRSRFTIPEGSTVARTLEIIAKSVDGMSLTSLKQAAGNPAALGLPSYAGGKLEGFLFPATYDVEPGTSAVEVLTMMVDRFEVAAESAQLVERAATLGITPYQAVIVASLVEGETGAPADRGKVSRVAYNRLDRGMRLQFDSTVKYVYGLRGVTKTRLLYRDLEIQSPYNTYRVEGLPPGPINSPGDAALEAALEPTPGPWLYFVVIDKQGNSGFTDSPAEFEQLKARYQRDVLGGG